MIWISKRRGKPGHAQKYLDEWQKAANMQFWLANGLIATSEMASTEDNMIWSLRLFTHPVKGFKHHAMGAFPWLLRQLIAKVFPNLDGQGKDKPFPGAWAFTDKKSLDYACSLNPNNVTYQKYASYWDEGLIGPKPDFAK